MLNATKRSTVQTPAARNRIAERPLAEAAIGTKDALKESIKKAVEKKHVTAKLKQALKKHKFEMHELFEFVREQRSSIFQYYICEIVAGKIGEANLQRSIEAIAPRLLVLEEVYAILEGYKGLEEKASLMRLEDGKSIESQITERLQDIFADAQMLGEIEAQTKKCVDEFDFKMQGKIMMRIEQLDSEVRVKLGDDMHFHALQIVIKVIEDAKGTGVLTIKEAKLEKGDERLIKLEGATLLEDVEKLKEFAEAGQQAMDSIRWLGGILTEGGVPDRNLHGVRGILLDLVDQAAHLKDWLKMEKN